MFTQNPGEMIQFDEHMFQVGWLNHQPAISGSRHKPISISWNVSQGFCPLLNWTFGCGYDRILPKLGAEDVSLWFVWTPKECGISLQLYFPHVSWPNSCRPRGRVSCFLFGVGLIWVVKIDRGHIDER